MRGALEQRLFASPASPVDIGGFVLIERAGFGAMGVVYRAYDPKLRREVALKLVRPDVEAREAGQRRSVGRLLREARSAAQVSHPNVVTVYEVAEVEGGFCIAMEYVRGMTLRTWCLERRRSWSEVLDMFIPAGRGLEAAHRVGVVHRDFKPENVLIDEHGRPRVADFGLARSSGEEPSLASSSRNHDASTPSSAFSTEDGAAVGTLAYMSSEQHLGGEVGPASDQFSFCVSLWEALWTERPYPQVEPEALRAAVVTGARDRPRRLGEVPRALLHAVERGLAPDPRHRFGSMSELLDELDRIRSAPRRARQRWAFAAGSTVVVGLLWGGSRAAVGAPRCEAAADLAENVWNESRRHAVRQRFDDAGVPFASHSGGRVLELLDDYVDGWKSAHTDACRATWVRGEQSQALLDRRMACLRRGLSALDAYAAQLEQADALLVQGAVAAAEQLPVLERCAAVERLQAMQPVPFDATRRAHAEETQERLTQTEAIELAGRYREALAVAERAVEAADRSEHAPSRAEAYNALGRIRASVGTEDAGRARERAFSEALRGADDVQAATAAIALTLLLDRDEARRDQAALWSERAAALIQRMGGELRLEADRLEAKAQVELSAGEVTNAVESFQDALVLAERADAPALKRATLAMGLAKAQVQSGAYDDAERALDEVLIVLTRELGPDHPRLAETYGALGTLAARRGNGQSAYAWFVRARDLLDASLGEHVSTAGAHANLGNAARALGRLDEAQAEMELAARMFARTVGETSRQEAALMSNLGNLAASRGDVETASSYYRRAIEHPANAHRDHALEGLAVVLQRQGEHDRALELLYEAKQIREQSGRADLAILSQMHIGSVLLDAQRLPESIEAHREALEAMERDGLSTHLHRADAFFGIGEALVRLGRMDEAIEPLETSLTLHASTAATPRPLEEARAAIRLAQALLATKRDPVRAAELARHANDALADDPTLSAEDRDLIATLARG